MTLCAIVVVACHFAERNKLCKTTIARLERALDELKKTRLWQYVFVVTGGVPYEPGGKTLAELMQEYLRSHGIRDEILIAKDQTGTFAEPKIVCALLKYLKHHHLNQLIVVSSDWQLSAGEPFWRKYAAESYLQLHIVPVLNTGGWRTRLFYAMYAAFIHTMLFLGLWRPRLEEFLYRKLYAPRYTKGFRANGCA